MCVGCVQSEVASAQIRVENDFRNSVKAASLSGTHARQ